MSLRGFVKTTTCVILARGRLLLTVARDVVREKPGWRAGRGKRGEEVEEFCLKLS